MLTRFAPMLAAFALVALSVPAIAADKDAQKSESPRQEVQADKQAASGSIVFGDEKKCVDNPRFNPDNDENGPRASESWSDSTPYVGTSSAGLVPCR
ncbi:hypothetical protein [Gloeobacter morelensis]|uniref:Uncharacterized protein n=1 Tax=Gloeobacter morelensis MG652769 TaxID=2781736 RepID=A0ABY3PMZ4_9CYAN|nr:hypothetical protein [Gloeobacter morelensis]UFP94953.1 hypothetical protein ISF26_01510 [Gloeobacter morelensis MG652769]